MTLLSEKKLRRCGEAAFVLGILGLACSTVMTAKADFGMSMVMAPAYVLAAWLGIPSGTASYLWQGLLVLITCLIVLRFRLSYLFSFCSAVLFGLMVNLFTVLLDPIPSDALWQRLLFFIPGIALISCSVALLFRTYLPPQAPELFVKELSEKLRRPTHRCKYAYDIASCVLAVVLSFLLLGSLRFVGVGTLVCTLVNGPLIGFFGRALDRRFGFEPRFPRLASFFDRV